jgi:hypothetical protein
MSTRPGIVITSVAERFKASGAGAGSLRYARSAGSESPKTKSDQRI